MSTYKLFISFLLLPAMILSYTDYSQTKPLQIEGTVVNEATGEPIQKAFIYISHGNEETLSNGKGQFVLRTWHELPVTLTVELAGYETRKLTISSVSKSWQIRLKKD